MASNLSLSALTGVLLDYGHTIVDFTPAEDRLLPCYEGVREMLVARAYHQAPEASVLIERVSRHVETVIVDSYVRGDLQEQDVVRLFQQQLQTIHLDLSDVLVREIITLEHRALMQDLSALPENLETLRALRQQGLKIGIVSNASFLPELMHADLDRLGIGPLVDLAVFSSEIGVRKPHPAIYRRVLDGLGVAPDEALFVGDRLRDDIAGAQRLGMRTVQTLEFRQEDPEEWNIRPDYQIRRLPELLPHVQSPKEYDRVS